VLSVRRREMADISRPDQQRPLARYRNSTAAQRAIVHRQH